uniref:Uncharacterized protein n=1 Tax=Anguilla anguilla TaxID=7936 RepID=A0A0E9UBV6_ANGAN
MRHDTTGELTAAVP